MKVNMTQQGEIVNEKSFYEVELTGSYRYSQFDKGYWYEVKSIVPELAISDVFSDKLLFE